MSNDPKSIHEFDFSLICEYFSLIPRQGPGSEESTLKALGFIGNLNAESNVLDIGCGTGGQTMVLAKHLQASIIGLDLFPTFIDLFQQNAVNCGVQNRVTGMVGSMDNLPFQNEQFDLLWSEGAIYNIGFQRGLKEWKRFLKKGGYLAVTEACWFTNSRPEEIDTFWKRDYPEIDTIPVKVQQLQDAGYLPIATFVLPEHCWTTNFYEPQKSVQKHFLEKHHENQFAKDFLQNQQHEAKLYDQFKEYYGYVFFIGRNQN